MANIVLDKILSGYNLAKINNNFEKIENIINEILVHKDGYNALSNSLDINGQKLLNVGDIEINGQSILEGLPALIEGYNEVIESIGEYEDNIQNILDNAIGAGTAATLSYTNKQAVFTVDKPVVALSELELPHYYTVGTNSLRLSVNGSVWYRGKDFDELGSIGASSKSIRLLKSIPMNTSVEVWIDAQNDQSEYVSHIAKAADIMEEYSPSSLENFVSAMDEYKSFNTEEILNNAVSTLNVLSNYNATANNTLTQLQSISTYIASAKNDVEVSYNHINDLYRLLMELQEYGLNLESLEESVDALADAVSSANTLVPFISAACNATSDYTSLASSYKDSAYSDKNIAEYNRISTNYMMEGTPEEVASALGHEGISISAMYESTSEMLISSVAINSSVENLYNDVDISTSQASTYAEVAEEAYNNISNITSDLSETIEEAKQIVDQAEEIVEGALLKSGGQMSGDIYKSTNDTRLVVGGGTDSGDGAYVRLSGLNETGKEGQFVIHADGDNNYCELVGKADKTLKWGNDDVLTSASTLDASKLNVSYLPTAGGTMTGSIKFATEMGGRPNDTSFINLQGGSSNSTGARLLLNGSERTGQEGEFTLYARSASGNLSMNGKPSGSLTWGGNEVLTTANGLPLSGGTMTGNIRYNVSDTIFAHSVNGITSGRTILFGGHDYATGASAYFFGKDHASTPGEFDIYANKGTGSRVLTGKPNGSLTWASINISAMGMPSGTYTNITLPATEGTITAPADGWIILDKQSSGNGQYLGLVGRASHTSWSSSTNQRHRIRIPVTKNEVVTVIYSFGGDTNLFRFYYANGSVWEKA